MAYKLVLTQRTDRHVVKRLDSDTIPAVYEASFGAWQTSGFSNSLLNFPWGITHDASNNLYVCDTANQRVVKLDDNMNFVASYSTITTVGVPYAIAFLNSDIYIVGVYEHRYVRIERITTGLISVRTSNNLNTPTEDIWFRPTGIVPSFTAGDFIISGCGLDVFLTTETTTFSSFVRQQIVGETTTYPNLYATTQYFGAVKHSINDNLYLNNGRKIIQVDNTFTNVGDSDIVSKTIVGLKEGKNGTLLAYNADSQIVVRYDSNLNFVENVYATTGGTIALDAYDVMDFVEINI
jgi:hypothetical protein